MILHLTLYKECFDAIRSGTKTEEYRENKEYWRKRLRNKTYDTIYFRNGYSKNARMMIVECKGIEETEECFVIKLGAMLNRGAESKTEKKIKKGHGKFLKR